MLFVIIYLHLIIDEKKLNEIEELFKLSQLACLFITGCSETSSHKPWFLLILAFGYVLKKPKFFQFV